MINTCQNCHKDYQAKRRSGKFCSTNCRVSAWEKAQPLLKTEQIVPGPEEYLALKIQAYAKAANDLLVQMMDGDRGTDAIHRMVTLVRAMGKENENSVVREVLTSKSSTPN